MITQYTFPPHIKAVLDTALMQGFEHASFKQIEDALDDYYGSDRSFKVRIEYNHAGDLHLRLEFNTEEDIVMFKLMYCCA